MIGIKYFLPVPYSLGHTYKINNVCASSSSLCDIYGVNESNAMSVSIDRMHTHYNDVEHKLHLNYRAQLPLTKHEDLWITRKSSKQPHMSVHDEISYSSRPLKICIFQQCIGTMYIIHMNARNKKVCNGTKKLHTYSLTLDKKNCCASSSSVGDIYGVENLLRCLCPLIAFIQKIMVDHMNLSYFSLHTRTYNSPENIQNSLTCKFIVKWLMVLIYRNLRTYVKLWSHV